MIHYNFVLEQKRLLQEEIRQLTGDTEHIKKEVYEMQLEENMIRNNIATQKQTLSNIEKQSPDTDELAELMRKVCSLKEGKAFNPPKKYLYLNSWKYSYLLAKRAIYVL